MILGLLALCFDFFCLLYWCLHAGPGPLIIAALVSIIAIVLAGVGKGGCHVAGLVLSIVSLVFAVILFAVFGGIELLIYGRIDSLLAFFTGGDGNVWIH